MDKLHRAAGFALNTILTRRQVFWNAFVAGLAAPTMLYAQPPSYHALIRDFSVRGSFAEVGKTLAKSVDEIA